MPPKKSKTNEQIKGDEAEELIKVYLKDQYRPYAVPDLILNLHNKINKPTMVKALESLVEKEEIISKTYGKSVYYAFKEVKVESTGAIIDQSVLDDLKKKVTKLETEVKNSTQILHDLISEPTNEDAQSEICRLEEEASQMNIKLQGLQKVETPGVIKELIEKSKEHTIKLESIFQNRRKIFLNFLALLNENLENYHNLMNIIGIDLDEVAEIKKFKI